MKHLNCIKIIKIKSRIVKDTNTYAACKNGPFIFDGNLVDFVNGYPEKIGGWQQEQYFRTTATGTTTTAQGKPKDTFLGEAQMMVQIELL